VVALVVQKELLPKGLHWKHCRRK